jgi:hypothetical protein
MRESNQMLLNKDEYVAEGMAIFRPQRLRLQLTYSGFGAVLLVLAVLFDGQFEKGFLAGAGAIFLLFGILLGRSYQHGLRKSADEPAARAFFAPYRILFDEATIQIHRGNGVIGIYPWDSLFALKLKPDRLHITPVLNHFLWVDRSSLKPEDWDELCRIARAQSKRFSE